MQILVFLDEYLNEKLKLSTELINALNQIITPKTQLYIVSDKVNVDLNVFLQKQKVNQCVVKKIQYKTLFTDAARNYNAVTNYNKLNISLVITTNNELINNIPCQTWSTLNQSPSVPLKQARPQSPMLMNLTKIIDHELKSNHFNSLKPKTMKKNLDGLNISGKSHWTDSTLLSATMPTSIHSTESYSTTTKSNFNE